MQSSTLLLLASSAIPVFSAALSETPVKREVSFLPPLDDAHIPIEYTNETADAYDAFLATPVVRLGEAASSSKRQEAVIPDFVFVLHCTEQGFRGDCLVFGAPPGTCGKCCHRVGKRKYI